MAKNDNLTDFLRGIAGRLRALLGTADPINPQDFEDKIQTVRDEAYSQGFAEGGPTGITATAPDVLYGKVFGSGGSAKATGTMPDQSNSIRTITTDTVDQSSGAFWLQTNNDLWIAPGKGYWGSWNWNISRLQIKAANLASAIGLTAAKIMKGNTILGIAGTGMPMGAAIWHSGPQYGTANIPPKYTYGVVSSGTLPAGTYRFVSSWTPYNDKIKMTLYVGGAAKSTITSSGGLGMSDNTFTVSGSQNYYLRQSDTGIYMYGTAALIKIG